MRPFNIGRQREAKPQSRSALPIAPAASPSAAGVTVELWRGGEVARIEEAWRSLASSALVPNSFYEPFFVLPALRFLSEGQQVFFAAIFSSVGRDGSRELWGLFPLEVHRTCLGIPVRTLSFWQHQHCFLSTPLIHREHAREAIEAFWRWLETKPFGCAVLDTRLLVAEGPFAWAWSDCVLGRRATELVEYARAFYAPVATADEYVTRRLGKKRRHECERQERRLGETGALIYSVAQTDADAEAWIRAFLELEARGWKGGAEGAAFEKDASEADFFAAMTRAGFREGKVALLALTLDGRPLAMKHNLLAAPGGYTFKIAFDESYAKYSPGVLLELENMRWCASNHPEIEWLDSCAAPRHTLKDRVWGERRLIARSIISFGSLLGDALVALLPALRAAKARLRPNSGPAHFRVFTSTAQ